MRHDLRYPVTQIFTWRTVHKLAVPTITARLNADPAACPSPDGAGWTRASGGAWYGYGYGWRVLAALAGDVIKVVDRVVDEVAGEGFHGEAGPVAAATDSLPLAAGHGGKPAGDGLGGFG
jgi:hypothetical protein